MLVGWLVMVALVALLLWSIRIEHPWLEWVFKPLAAATFIATGLSAGGLETRFGTVLVVGLVLAAGGDVLLIPKNKRAFLGGLISFLAGHVAYALAFGLLGLDLSTTAIASAGVVVAGSIVLRWLWPNVESPMRAPVLAYVLVISTMVALAAGAAQATGNWWLLVGAVAFYLSDLAVARHRFVSQSFVNRAWGLPVYFFAQMLLASQAGFSG